MLPAGFFVAGVITRSILRETETRWQMVGFALLTLLIPVLMRGLPPRIMPVCAVAAISGILIAKFSIEGLPAWHSALT
jgi:uncharacterized membrane protein YoaK (UPF0700 family)